MSDLDKINSIFNAKIDSVKTKEELQNLKTEFLEKNGQITQQFKTLGKLEPENRKKFASNLNKIKDDLTNQIEKIFEIDNAEINEKLKNEKIDITLPVRPYHKGKFIQSHKLLTRFHRYFLKLAFQ